MVSRRKVLLSSATLAGLAALSKSATAQQQESAQARQNRIAQTDYEPGLPGRDYQPVIVPSSKKAPFKISGNAKVFHLTAEEYEHSFAPNLKAYCWGFNKQVNGPVIEAVEGDFVRIYVTNKLPAPTTVHWHGFILPNGMDGVSGLTQNPIPPGETWVYEFKLVQNGTFMFHSHHDTMTQEGMGLTGMFIIHPRNPQGPQPERDFALLLHEWRIDVGAHRPNPNEMTDFNVLTINGKVFPYFDPLIVRTGQRVRMRIGNLSPMDHHPIHLHGYEFYETAVDGYDIPKENQRTKVTTLVGVGETRDIEFDAVNPGDWAFHCHMTHHIMNQMGHEFPNMIGFDKEGFDKKVRTLIPKYMTMGTEGMNDMTASGMKIPQNSIPMARGKGGYNAAITLGGMAGVLKVRDQISDEMLEKNQDPGWYEPPAGTMVYKASPQQLNRDGIHIV